MSKVRSSLILFSFFLSSFAFAGITNCYDELSRMFQHEKIRSIDHRLGSILQTQPTRSGPSKASIYNPHSFTAKPGEFGFNYGYYKYAIEEIEDYNNF